MTTTLHEPELARLARRRAMVPYLLLLPGMAWLFAFFLVPILRLIGVSLQSGIYPNYEFTWQWDNYARLWTQYGGQVWNSLRFAFIATVICLVLAYPLAYFIAFRGGRWKNFLLVLLLMPFLLPTFSWKIILADEGLGVGTLKSIVLLGPNATLLATSVSVIAGIAYNFLPFMALPIYVSLEKLDRSLIEAATDLYARPTEA